MLCSRNPTPEPAAPAGREPIQWLPYQAGNLSYAFLDAQPLMDVDYRQQEFAFHNRYLNYIIYGKEFYLELE